MNVDGVTPHRDKPVDQAIDKTTNMLAEFPRHLNPASYSRQATQIPTQIRPIIGFSKVLARQRGQLRHATTANDPDPGFITVFPDYKPELETTLPSAPNMRRNMKEMADARDAGICLVARELIRSHQQISICLPTRFNQHQIALGTEATRPSTQVTPHYAIWVRFTDGTDIILPVALHIIGRSNQPYTFSRNPETLDNPWDSSQLRTSQLPELPSAARHGQYPPVIPRGCGLPQQVQGPSNGSSRLRRLRFMDICHGVVPHATSHERRTGLNTVDGLLQ